MSHWQPVLQLDAEIDLAPLKRYMADNDCPIYIFEERGQQVVSVLASADPARVDALLSAWRDGEVDRTPYMQAPRQVGIAPDKEGNALTRWRDYPLTMGIILLAYLLVIVMSASPAWEVGLLQVLVFQEVAVRGDNLYLLQGWPGLEQAWRYLSPMLLHFSFVHILFNSLMLLEVGRRIEAAQGGGRMLLLVAVCALISNAGQFYASPNTLFGGLSGVVFGLIGYAWLFDKLRGEAVLALPSGLFISAMIWLVLCFSPLPEWAGLGQVANAAHIWGLLGGLLIASLTARPAKTAAKT